MTDRLTLTRALEGSGMQSRTAIAAAVAADPAMKRRPDPPIEVYFAGAPAPDSKGPQCQLTQN